MLASGSADNTAKIWKAGTFECQSTLKQQLLQEETKGEVWQRMTPVQQQKFQQMTQREQKQMFEALVRVHLEEKKREEKKRGHSDR